MNNISLGATCAVSGCSRRAEKRGWCCTHYSRWRHHGDVHFNNRGAPVRYFYDVVVKHDSDECLLWPFALTEGYGHIHVNGKKRVASRWICEVTYGPAPSPEHEAAHSCGNRGCVAWRHLRWATPKENCADRILHGTKLWGEKVYSAKLTEESVEVIRQLGGTKSQAEIARRVNIHPSQVSRILAGKAWVEPEARI